MPDNLNPVGAMPDFKFKDVNAIPEELRGDAKEVNGEYVINLVPNSKLVEFRDKNINLMKELDPLKQRMSTVTGLIGDDIEKFKGELAQMRDIAQQVADGKLKGNDAIQTEVQRRVEAARTGDAQRLQDLQTKLTASEAASSGWRGRHDSLALQTKITQAVVGKDSVANPEALPDILNRASQTWKVTEEGDIVAMKGNEKIYGANGDPITLQEWLTKLVENAPYLGKSSAGGGAAGGSKDDKFGGLSEAEFMKLSPAERMTRARKAQTR